LVSGEALVRNFLLGFRQSRAMGVEPMRVGYICDMFGHNSQFPQVLSGFGIDSAVFFRGKSDLVQSPPYRWEAADGSRIMAIKLPDGGGYGMCTVAVRLRKRTDDEPLGCEADVDALVALAASERERTGLDASLLLDALDHQPPEEVLVGVLAGANAKSEDCEFLWSDFNEFLAAVRPSSAKWPVLKGELRDPAKIHGNVVLNNVTSSRVHLKQANVRCQSLLESWAEPLAVLAAPLGFDGAATSIALAWKYLLLNHPHDSICGCSLDQVHSDMIYRFDQSRMLAEIVRRNAAETIAAATKIDCEGIALVAQVWNPLPVERDEVIDLTVPLPEREHAQGTVHDQVRFQTFELLDDRGREVPYQKLADLPLVPDPWMSPKGTPRFGGVTPVQVAVRLKLPACGYTTLRARWLERTRLIGGTMSTGPGVMENKHLRVEIQSNGTFDVTDKRNGAVYHGLGLLEDMADIGDGWNHFSPTSDEIHSSLASAASVAKVADGNEKVVYRITHRLPLPARFDNEARRRSAETRDLVVATELTLRQDATSVECTTKVENVIRDHSLRVLLPTDLKVDEYLAETPFDVVRRTVEVRDPSQWREPEQDVKPITSFIGAHDGKRGLFVTTEGLHEAGLREDERRTLVLTLYRAFPRNWQASVRDQVGGELLREVTLRWQVVPVAGAWNAAEVAMKARALTAGTYLHPSRLSGEKPSLPPTQSLMALEKGHLTLTSLKAADAGTTAVVRLVNLSERAVKDRLRFARKVKRFRPCTLEEAPAGAWQKPQGGWLGIEAKAKQIVSLEIEWTD
ncbi:MAG: hypothetical protein JXL80_03510, partial [Planctomycetes bacterium]|nr:hypothetical protein [Planctomycetota bacterium]